MILRGAARAFRALVRPRRGRPSLSVSIITRDSEGRLASAVARARRFADEIVVGVDAASSDRTWDLACDLADVAYRFRHKGQLAPAHMLPFRYCTGRWLLRLDDDEAMEEGFEDVAAQVMADERLTHCWLARKWVVSLDPPLYLHAAPWYPDYQLRLMRNDASLVFKPPRYHSGYRAAGPGVRDARCAILHYEPILCSDDARQRKRQAYLDGGGSLAGDRVFAQRKGERRPFQPPREGAFVRSSGSRIDTDIHDLEVRSLPPWGWALDHLDLPAVATAGQELPVVLHLRNTGAMSWVPYNNARWPMLQVGCHLEMADGELIARDGPRLPIETFVPPGGTSAVAGTILAPDAPGDYVLSWDMVSELECWFEDCGSTPARVCLRVNPSEAPGVASP